MTHDELLDLVQKTYDVDRSYELFKALRAVVEDCQRILLEYQNEDAKYWEGIRAQAGATLDVIEKELG